MTNMEITENLKKLLDVKNGAHEVVAGCQLGQRLFCSACLKEFFVYVVSNSEQIDQICAFLSTLSRKPVAFPYVDEPMVYSYGNSNAYKIKALSSIIDNKCDCIVVDVRALTSHFPNIEKFKSNAIAFKVGQTLDRETLHLSKLGFSRVTKIEKTGQFAVRGDIVDISSETVNVRISFFDDEIESIKTMNFEDNVAIESLNEVTVYPNTLYFESDKNALLQALNTCKNNENADAIAIFSAIKSQIDENLQSFTASNSYNFLCFAVNNENLLNFLPNATIVLDEPQLINQSLENHLQTQARGISEYLAQGQIYQGFEKNYFSESEIKQILSQKTTIAFDSFVHKANIEFESEATQNYKNRPEIMVYDLKRMLEEGYAIRLFTSSEIDRSFLTEFLDNQLIAFSVENALDRIYEKGVKIINQPLPLGCILVNEKIALIPYGNSKVTRKTQTSAEKPFFELPQAGDYVVHSFHGIGQCLGIQKMKISGYTRDYIVIKYDGTDKLYLPVENANEISKYIGAEVAPKLNKIGGAEFERAKNRVRQQLEVMATDMLKIYAEREKSQGHKYEIDTFLQKQFEESFVYEETPDQRKAIADVKADMSSGKIMDRLICGDVGYGKTEVAFRATMIAIDNGKQAVLLAPTTILSEQHYKSAVARFSGFGVKIAVLNRFKTPSEQNEIIEKLAKGEIDLLIGTQKVLNEKIVYKNLGLLICDEEQKLGVKDKERIKKLKHNIDVLSMSATPIPRTLHMSLVGIRDISTIATAPQMRKAVQTTICEYSNAVVLTAVSRELARGGQILIVKNRVEGLEEYVHNLRQLLPQARIGYAHGQMKKEQLENTMKDVFDCKIDILVATTLIENGIDLPNANTMIVVDADKFGLSQLYQLRGRVGRSSAQAYAYFTFGAFKALSEEGQKRLQAMQEYTELGSGFKIAMRDLELRGAGTVLGEKQSGHLEKVGYDMYCKLLEQVVATLKGKEEKAEVDTKIDIDIQAEIPDYYINSQSAKMEIIDIISKLASEKEFETQMEKLRFSYGAVPQATINLAKIACAKNILKSHGARRIIMKQNGKNFIELEREPEFAIPNTQTENFGEYYHVIFNQNDKIMTNLDNILKNVQIAK